MKIVCAGDSLTKADISTDYVAELQEGFTSAEFRNAGVNYDMSSGLLSRIDTIIAQKPDLVTILIGTNNVRYSLSTLDAKSLRKRWKLEESPSPESYHRDLSSIVSRLQSGTSAHIALLSPPPIGEDLDSEAIQRSTEFSGIVREVAETHTVRYLPLHETMLDFLRQQNTVPKTHFVPGIRLAATAATQHFMLRRSFDAISRSRGLQLSTDTIHLNSRGAQMITRLIAEFIESSNESE